MTTITPMPIKMIQKYKFHKEIGHGSYGTVYSATHIDSNTDVAIKKVGSKNFEEVMLAKRALRELKLLRHLNGHENIAAFLDVDLNDQKNFSELYLIEGLMEADLHQIIRSKQVLTDQHFQYFTYQLLRGLKWMHSADVLHRDLKPGNLLINSDCELRICDFGLARGVVEEGSKFVNTEYVATRYYRAPEVVLSPKHYSKAIDVWSVGTILGEMMDGRVMFKGQHYVDQLKKIFEVLGTPSDPTLTALCSDRVLNYIQSWPRYKKTPLKHIFPNAHSKSLDLMDKLLIFDPRHRITAEEALSHPYFAAYHNAEDEPSHPSKFNFAFESAKTIKDIKEIAVFEVLDHKAKRDAGQQQFKTPSSSPTHQKPLFNMQSVQGQPRFVEDLEARGGKDNGDECLEDEMNSLNI